MKLIVDYQDKDEKIIIYLILNETWKDGGNRQENHNIFICYSINSDVFTFF